MDGNRFDTLIRMLGRAGSRRGIGRATLAAALLGSAGVGGPTGVPEASAACREVGRPCQRGENCCGRAACKGRRCRCPRKEVACGRRCVDLLNDPANCGACGRRCPSGACLHGTCGCDPFANLCPSEIDGQCTCGAIVGTVFQAACVDRNSACDLDKPCDANEDCPFASVCLKGCSDPPDPQPNRCSTPCVPV